MFEQNSDGHVIGAPRDAFWKSGEGGFALIIVPSLDLVISKMGGSKWQLPFVKAIECAGSGPAHWSLARG